MIGEHIDYNEGYFLPCAVNKEMIMAAQPHKEEVVFHSYEPECNNKILVGKYQVRF